MDQNSNMGGFSPMPGQNGMNGGAVPMGQPAPMAAPGMGGMPMNSNVQNPMMPGAQVAPQAAAGAKKDNTLVETIILIVVCLIAATAIVFAVVFFMQYNDLNSNFESQKSAEIAKKVAEQQEIDNAKFAEDEKLPYSKFTGPSDYGSISFEYPKTWSVYVDSDGTNTNDFVAYFHPAQVDPVKDENSRYSLRFSILNQQITTVQAEYDDRLEDGSLTSSVFNADNNKISGTKFVGKINENIQGTVILFKVNDKTAVLQTDATIYQNDFETLVSKLRRNS